jgi:beta-lactamase regulating signal transducer with metallopeptidase domain
MLWWLAQNGLAAGALAALVALMCWLGRLGPAARHALWLIVLLKLVTPPVILWPYALPALGEKSPAALPTTVDVAKSEPFPMLSKEEAIVARDDPPSSEEFSFSPLREDGEEKTAINNQAVIVNSNRAEWILSLLRTLWLTGTVGMCLLQLFRIVRFQRLLVGSDPAPRWLDHLVAEVADRIGVHRPPTLIVAGGMASPSVWSVGRPKLLWPASLLERLPDHCHRSVVAHELAHLRRRDHWIGWVQLIAECVWWWNPLFWYVRRQVRFNAELACDAWVVTTLPDDRRVYAEALIEVTELLSQTAAPMPALGIRSTARQDFERRLTMIMRDRVPCRVPLVGLLAIGVLALASLPGWSQPTVEVQKPSDGQDVSGSEKRIIVTLPGDMDHQDAKHVIRLVEENAGDKGVDVRIAPEKHIVLQVTKDVDYQDAKRVIGIVQKTAGDKPVVVGLEAKSDPSGDRDSRLDKLERQLQELLKEVHALRTGSPKPEIKFRADGTRRPGETSDRPAIKVIEEQFELKHAPADTAPTPKSDAIRREKVPATNLYRYQAVHPQDGKTAGAVALMRTTYKLPHAKAEALATLLAERRGRDVLETNVEGDNLTITTTPEAQRAISEFVEFLTQTETRIRLQLR